MSKSPLISILTPTHNRRAMFLPDAIASVQALRLACAYEHVIVDDGSTDGTAEYLESEARADPRIRWVRHEHSKGVAAARNSALHASLGEFLVDLDDDDVLLARGIERRLQYLRDQSQYWAVHAIALKIDEMGRYLVGQDVVNYLCTDPARCARLFFSSRMIPNASTAMYRRAALLEIGGWDESLSCCEDYDLWLHSLARFGPPGFIDEPVVLYRTKDHGLGIDSIRNGTHEQNQRRVQARWRHLLEL